MALQIMPELPRIGDPAKPNDLRFGHLQAIEIK
jgi:hypothetical protein